ncbi:hypothetical protein LMG27174_07214 [Paraburkholderia rhynchosiae]|uniref:Uncharacterized protein n=1 Tax=Paraburkholderia rhynchosiae TaxID=487049 RepID=A0A6J5CVI4_9BURK|nr:hypothetical protein LMG27174_07214 [Paraburkholderia rhynchosiae]
MDPLQNMRVFVCAVEARQSYRRAVAQFDERHDVARSSELDAHLCKRLLNRSTRRLVLTTAG